MGNRMIVDKINEWAIKTPQKIAFVHAANEMNYNHFAKLIESTRRHLMRNSIPIGTTVVVSITNLCDAWIVVLAARANGLRTIFVPSVEDISALNLNNISQILTTEIEAKNLDIGVDNLKNAGITKITPDLYSHAQLESVSLLTCSHPQPGEHILLSSGTSGVPKKLLVTRRLESFIISVEYAEYVGINSKTEFNLFNLSIGSVSAYRGAIATWYAGGTVVLDQSDNFESLGRRSTNLMRLKPAIAKQLHNCSSDGRFFNSKLLAYIGGGVISSAVLDSLKCNLTPRLHFSYAATELLYGIMLTKLESEQDLIWQSKVPSRTIEVIDSTGAVCAPNCEGEIRISLMEYDHTDYLNDTEASSKAFRDGYFYPGDMAVQREDGRFRILGRVSDVLIMNGHKYAVAPIEADLCARLKVRDLCLFARQNEKTEEELFVVMECDRLPPSEELQAVNRDFAMFQKVHFWPFLRFPRNAGGKTDRRMLRRVVYGETDTLSS